MCYCYFIYCYLFIVTLYVIYYYCDHQQILSSHAHVLEIVKAGQQCVCSRLGSCAPAQLRRWWAGDLVKHLSVLSLVVGRVTLDSSTYVGAVSTLGGTANLLGSIYFVRDCSSIYFVRDC